MKNIKIVEKYLPQVKPYYISKERFFHNLDHIMYGINKTKYKEYTKNYSISKQKCDLLIKGKR